MADLGDGDVNGDGYEIWREPMCGIVGVVGTTPCVDILLEGLARLEYRGYDSAGIATLHEGRFETVRAVGKLANLARSVHQTTLLGTVGIGHTRWATHGRPSMENAHPHTYGRTTVVHNGIIENYAALKRELELGGDAFSSETDSEVIAHLVAHEEGKCGDLVLAVRNALMRLHGSFAVAVMHLDHQDIMVGARRMSPLVVGVSPVGSFLASDVPAVLSQTRDFVFLEDNDVVKLTVGGFEVTDLESGLSRDRRAVTVHWTPAMAEKGGYKHFMLKEIHEQPRSVADTIRPHLDLARGEVVLGELDGLIRDLSAGCPRVSILACGTSYHAGLVGKQLIEAMAGWPCEAEVASEYRYRHPLVRPGDLIIAVSQSGETADTLAAARDAKEKGARVLAICNVVGSSLERMADATLNTLAGPEIGVASTKAFTSQLAAFYLLASYFGQRGNRSDPVELKRFTEELVAIPSMMETVLRDDSQIRDIAAELIRSHSMLYLGRGLSFPMALEGALKLKELSYIHAEGYAAGEMKHGPIALVDDQLWTVVVVPSSSTRGKTLSNVEEIRSRGGRTILVGTEGDDEAKELADRWIPIPVCDPRLSPFLTVLPLQMLAYYVADLKGTDVDQPRNLAKSVTVE
jgi:glucosamine--fructose-6-phosphate aminotransferase (isomerizing)